MNFTDTMLFCEAIIGDGDEPAKTVFQMELTEGYGLVEAECPFVVGQTYSVDIDGTVYIREAKKVIAPDGVSECVLIGNTAALGGEDNGDHFMILAAVEDETEFVQVWDNNGGTHITVTEYVAESGSSSGGVKALAWHTGVSGLEVYDNDGVSFTKLSNTPFTKNAIEGGVFGVKFEDITVFQVLTGEAFDLLVTEEDGFVGIGEIFLSGDDTAVSSIGLPSGGVWVVSGTCQVASLVWGL